MDEEIYQTTCPDCKEPFQLAYSPERREGCTADCPNCGSLLVFWEGETKNFHKTMHELNNGEWPEDGEGTGFVEVS